jgi:hypothetical protein
MRVYLAGPMRGYPEYNHPAFNSAAEQLREGGHEVYSPAEQDIRAGFNPATDKADSVYVRIVMAKSLRWICRSAEAIVLLPGWQDSRGSLAEVLVAQANDIPVRELQGFLIDSNCAAIAVTWTPSH